VGYRGSDAIEPGSAVRMPRRRKRGTRELFGIQSVRAALRRISALGEGPGQRLGGKFVAEAALISGLFKWGQEWYSQTI
jgi:hypothetical protein